nr:MAG TPA: hypothetical protein [Caudoviricetes sp.]
MLNVSKYFPAVLVYIKEEYLSYLNVASFNKDSLETLAPDSLRVVSINLICCLTAFLIISF